MKRIIVLSCLLPISFLTRANDGAFKVNGNQLIPMYETDISVKKEILTIRRINSKQAEIDVYYEFFNPKAAKTIEVGFEAFSPSGDVDASITKDGRHPNISKFTVNLNGNALPFKVAIVHDGSYYWNGQFKAIPLAQALKEAAENDVVEYFYVYHFGAVFKEGLNIIHHTYMVDLSYSVEENYSLRYILTAAKRWANKQIDDFTLQIDMGAFQDVCIPNTFAPANSPGWQSSNDIRCVQQRSHYDPKVTLSEFFVRKGVIVFAAKDFKPAGELEIVSFNSYYYHGGGSSSEEFNSKEDKLLFSIEDQEFRPAADELSKRILHNLPFARRGYVFKAPELAAYFQKQSWYWPDPSYVPTAGELTRKEQDWLAKIK